MTRKLILTSFQTWLPHQKSNSSDDLLGKIAQLDVFSASLTFLRQLPVDISQASSQVIATIEDLQPDGIICCGMAESRSKLTVESCATCRDASMQIRLYHYCLSLCQRLRLDGCMPFLELLFGINDRPNSALIKTALDLETLLIGTVGTEISHDAGKFVCEGLYYEVLKYLRQRNSNIPCIFVHVPVLTDDNCSDIIADLQTIIGKMID